MEKRDFIKTGLLALGTMLFQTKSWALDFYPTTKNVEWAVLFATWCGSARDAGVWISEGMDGIADVFDVRENPDLTRYKHIIVGGAIRGGVTSAELQEYLLTHNASIHDRIRGLFAVCGNMRQPVTQELYTRFFTEHLNPLTGAKQVPSKVFLGRITWGLMEPDVRQRMMAIPNMEEYDNLKRSECMAFGRKVLRAVESVQQK